MFIISYNQIFGEIYWYVLKSIGAGYSRGNNNGVDINVGAEVVRGGGGGSE